MLKVHAKINSFCHKGIWESPRNLTCMSLDGGKTPEHPEKTHTSMERAHKLHTERPSSNPEFSCSEVTVWTTAPSCHPNKKCTYKILMLLFKVENTKLPRSIKDNSWLSVILTYFLHSYFSVDHKTRWCQTDSLHALTFSFPVHC